MKPRQYIPEQIARCMRPEDRQALGVETFEEADARGQAKVEAELQRACEAWLMRNDIAYLHLSPRAREKRGWPDLTFTYRGVPFGIQLKTATGKLTAEQISTLAQADRNGWTTAVCRSFREFRAAVESGVKSRKRRNEK